MSLLIHSKAFWSALVAFAGVIVMRYTQVPPEIWQSFVVFALVIIGLFTVDDVQKSVIATIRQMRMEEQASAKELHAKRG